MGHVLGIVRCWVYDSSTTAQRFYCKKGWTTCVWRAEQSKGSLYWRYGLNVDRYHDLNVDQYRSTLFIPRRSILYTWCRSTLFNLRRSILFNMYRKTLFIPGTIHQDTVHPSTVHRGTVHLDTVHSTLIDTVQSPSIDWLSRVDRHCSSKHCSS